LPLPRSSPAGVGDCVGCGVGVVVGSGVAVGVGVGVEVGLGRGLACPIGESTRQLSVTKMRRKACRGSGQLRNFLIWEVFIFSTKETGWQSFMFGFFFRFGLVVSLHVPSPGVAGGSW